MSIRIAVDAMGGDDAPQVVIEGAADAVRQANGQLKVVLVGPESILKQELDYCDSSCARWLEVAHAPDVIGMDESPTAAVKNKRTSSIHIGLQMHRAGDVDAFVSAGNTGAVMAASLFILGRLSGVARPSLIGFYPTTNNFCIVLDVGANVDCKPEHLVQFARMGSIYVEKVLQRQQPTVALMNIGEEPGKGNELVKVAHGLLQDAHLNFVGNIEGRDLMHHAADVVVCDGFIGNIMLKLGESVSTALMEMLAEEMKAQQLNIDEQRLVARVLHGVRQRFNYEEYGGAPLLGVNGNVAIGHGGSSRRAIEKLILSAVEMVRQDVTSSIASAIGVAP